MADIEIAQESRLPLNAPKAKKWPRCFCWMILKQINDGFAHTSF